MKQSDNDCVQLPLHEGQSQDDVALDDERRDDVAVLTSENGLAGPECVTSKRSYYPVQPRLSKLKFNCRWRQGAVLSLGIFLTVMALTLVVVGAVRSREHTSVKVLQIKQPVDLKNLVQLGDVNFTIAQLAFLTNVAIDKPTQQSSEFQTETTKPDTESFQAGYAVDGDMGTCSRTGLERTPSWNVDLLLEKTVNSVRILGSSTNGLHDIWVYVSSLANATTKDNLCGRMEGFAKTLDVRVGCSTPTNGRYVVIESQSRANTNESLVLCEVMVFQ